MGAQAPPVSMIPALPKALHGCAHTISPLFFLPHVGMHSLLWNFNAFNQFYIMLGRDPGIAAEVPSTLILREAFTNLKYGIGSALSIVLMLILLVITTVYLIALRGTAGAEEM